METKNTFKIFTIFEYEKEQDYLRKMHQSGWKLVKVSGLGAYHFEKCVPEDVIYQLDYNPNGIAHKDEYVKMFSDCGWEYLQDYVGYSYFRKPASETGGNEEIFCDDDSRLQMLDRVFKGRMLPLAVLFLCILVPQFIHGLTTNSILLTIMFGMLLGLYASFFVMFSWQYWKLKGKK